MILLKLPNLVPRLHIILYRSSTSTDICLSLRVCSNRLKLSTRVLSITIIIASLLQHTQTLKSLTMFMIKDCNQNLKYSVQLKMEVIIYEGLGYI